MNNEMLAQIHGGNIKEDLIFGGILISGLVVSVIIIPVLVDLELKTERSKYTKKMTPEQERNFMDNWNYYNTTNCNVLPRGTTPICLGWK